MSFQTKDKELNLGIIYRSPNATEQEDDLMRKQISTATRELNNLIIAGDFNLPEINWEFNYTRMHEKHRASKFLFTVNENKLHQHIKKATHHKPKCKPSTIDLVLTKDPDLIDTILSYSPIGKSHHSTLVINTAQESHNQEKCMIKKYQLDKGDYDGMRKEFETTDWEAVLNENNDDVDEAWKNLSDKIQEARDKFIPTKLVNTSKQTKKRSLVFEDSLVHLTKMKRIQFKIYKRFPNMTNYKAYVQARSNVTKYTKRMKRMKENKIAKNIKKNTKAFYQYINSKTKKRDKIGDLKKSDGQATSNDMEKASELNNFFTSVFTKEDSNNMPDLDKPTHDIKISNSATVTIEEMKKILETLKTEKSPGPDEIHPKVLKECAEQLAAPMKVMFDLTMKTGKVPKSWKQAEITAIYKKKGSKSSPGNYRPVSLTSVVCKAMEKIIKTKLNQHLKINDILADEQYGFVSGRSTETQLLTSIHHWQKALDEDKPVDIIYMDFKKAFDTVPHTRLIKKLNNYGVQGKLLEWIQSFLEDRSQHVKVNNAKSEEQPVTSGVPQGSVLGPTLFIYFINDLPKESIVSTKIFADDTKVYTEIESDKDRESLQETVDKMYNWTSSWLLKFNETKCQVLHLGENNPKYDYFIGTDDSRVKLEESNLEKDLGVYIDPNLNFEKHIEKITQKAASKCSSILRNFTFRSKEVLVPLFKSLIRPVLEYANTAWSGGLRKNINEVEKIQRSFTKNIYQVKHLPYEKRLEKLNLPSLEYRRFRGDLIQTFKIARNFYDNCTVNTLFNFKANERLRGHKYKINKIYYKKVQFKHFFTNRVANHWNNLPHSIVEAESTNIFKNKIDEHFKDQMFKINLFE